MTIAIYLMLSVLMSLVSSIYNDYLHGEFDGEFGNGLTLGIGFHVFDSSWLSLYFVDTRDNKFSMASGAVRLGGRTRHFICYFNGKQFNFTLRGYDRSGYLVRWFRMELSITNNSLNYREHYNDPYNLTTSNIFAVPKTPPDAFFGFPVARNFTKDEHKIFAWVGSVSSVVGRNEYDSTNRSIGCIYEFHVNDKSIKWLSNGLEYFSNACWRRVSQNICNRGKCHKDSISYRILDCSMSVMNTRKYCWEDLSIQPQPIFSFLVKEYIIKSTMIKFAWSQAQLKNYCLVEFVGRNGSTTLFHTNDNGDLVKCYGTNRSMNCVMKIWHNILINKTYVLLIEWGDRNMTVKISDGGYIKTFIDDIGVYPHLINIGFSTVSTMCNTFHEAIAFRYNISQLIDLSSFIYSSTSTRNSIATPCNKFTSELFYKIYAWEIILPWTLFVSLSVLVCIICFSTRICRRMRRSARPLSNQYEKQIQLTDIPPLPIRRNRQSAEFTYESIS